MNRIEIPALPAPKTALVTGGSGGIGKATAARLAALGTSVVVGYNSRRAAAEMSWRGFSVAGITPCASRLMTRTPLPRPWPK